MKDPYVTTDKVIKALNRIFIKRFRQANGDLLFMDELNVLKYCDDMYEEMLETVKKYFLLLARKIYGAYLLNGAKGKQITKAWVNKILYAYDDLAMYVFINEVDRKAQRFAESVIASEDNEKQIKQGLTYWSKMVQQYADTVTHQAVIQAFKDSGVVKVVWVTQKDNRVCLDCVELDGEVFDIDKLPLRPHWGCRCTIRPL